MNKKLLLILLFTSILSTAKAQIKAFSDDPAKFLTEMTSLFTILDDKDQRKEGEEYMLMVFTPFWNGASLSPEQKVKIIGTCNLMLKRKMKAFPNFMTYMKSLIRVSEANKLKSCFDPWTATLDMLLGKSTGKPFMDFLETSDSLFSSNYLFASNTTIWGANSPNYVFTFEEEPVIRFTSVTLTCYANDDSSVIYNTSGAYYPLQTLWVGSKGRVDWQRAAFQPNEVYADLGNYKINMSKREYEADSVTFYNTGFFGSTPLMGKLSEKVLANRRGEDALYPQFDSYDKRIEIKNIYRDVDYEGGFSMHGPKLLGSGDETADAILRFKREGKVFLVTRSKSYSIRKDRVNSERASVTIYYEVDSIYHPGLIMKYLDERRELTFLRDKEGLRQTPFFNTYHKLDMYFETLVWRMDEPKIDFKMIIGPGASGEAMFESANYFSESRFEKLRGIDEVHPLVGLRDYSRSINSMSFTVLEYANYRRHQVESVRGTIIQLAIMGFLNYNSDNDRIYLKDKVFEYLNAKAAKTDYDVLQFYSIISAESNATLSLLNWDLKMRGISKVFLSDSQKVYIYPADQEIVMKKNRDFVFSGRVHAGMFDYYGHDFSFEYDKFKLNLPIIDSMTFKVRSRTPDDYGYFPLVKVRSVVEDLSGDILIDHPNNKSGRKPFSEYPIFNSKKNSYVYYDQNSVFPGVYSRDDFFYRIDPFTLDSLDDFSTEGLEFKGYLSSAGIFPDLDQALKVMPDYSLGFIRQTPPTGYPTYGGKGNFVNKINLSNQGLRGDGTLKYLTSVSTSTNFLFFPDSMNAEVQDYVIKEQKSGVQYPPVTATNVLERWYPKQDIMVVSTTTTPAIMYTEETELNGALVLTPTGLTGKGTIEFKNANIVSRHYKFQNRFFDSDTCDFSLKTEELDELAFSTKNYSGHVDFDERKGEFKSNGGASLVEFPVNEYICYMDQFDWYMDKDEIDLQNNASNVPNIDQMTIQELADIDLSGSEFISVHPAQDSLRFRSSRAKYNMKEKIIYAYDVKIIRVADAAIFPGDGNVTILRKAEMLPLENAQILANTTTKYHTVSQAHVNIFGAKSYVANGFYDYVDEMEGTQKIFFTKIAVDSTLQTYGFGHISDSLQFTLSPYFDYQGDVSLFANHEFLTYTGGVRIHHECDTLFNHWIKFSAEINPYEIYIPIAADLKNITGDKMGQGIYFSADSIGVYSAFMTRKIKGGDIEVAEADGFLTYDKQSNEYRISSMDKLKQQMLPGRYLSLSVFKCLTRAEGKLSLGANLGRVKMSNYGIVDHWMREDSTMIYSAIEIDFFFAPEALRIMRENLAAASGLEGLSVSSELYTKYLGEVLGIEEADKVTTELQLYGQLRKFPELLDHTMVLADVTLKYNPVTKSYISVGKIGIATMGTTQINKYVNGRIELVLKRSGEKLTIYLEVSSSEWYFFSYSNGLMQAISSSKEWNDIIINTKPDDRSLGAREGEKAYSYYISTLKKKETFLKKTGGESVEEEEGD